MSALFLGNNHVRWIPEASSGPSWSPAPWSWPSHLTSGSFSFLLWMKVEVKSLSPVRLCATPWTVCSPPRSSVHEIVQARRLQWVAISRSSWPRNRTRVSCIAGGFCTNWAIRVDFLLLLFTLLIYFPYCPREILRKCGPAWNYD